MTSQFVEPKNLMKRVMAIAKSISTRPLVASRMLKTLFRQSQTLHLNEFFVNCAAIQEICHTTDHHIEAVSGILEKRCLNTQVLE